MKKGFLFISQKKQDTYSNCCVKTTKNIENVNKKNNKDTSYVHNKIPL